MPCWDVNPFSLFKTAEPFNTHTDTDRQTHTHIRVQMLRNANIFGPQMVHCGRKKSHMAVFVIQGTLNLRESKWENMTERRSKNRCKGTDCLKCRL